MSAMRIAVGQISCESDTFSSFVCDLDTVRSTGYLYEGEQVLSLAGTNNEVVGFLQTLRESGAEPVPLLASRWNSSALVSREAHAFLRDRLLARLREASPVDGVLLSCHGSMVAEGQDDPEGELGEAVRAIVGPDVPVAMTLDLHGNVTRRMVRSLDLILGYETYPHADAPQTGRRAATLVLRAARKEVRPVMAHVRVPMILTAFHASTNGDGPYAQLMRQTKALEREPGVLSTSIQFVGSYIDIPEMGCSTVVITDGDPERATREARRLAEAYWARRREFLVETVSVAEAVRRGRQIAGGPVILLDTADTTGGGAAGDSIDLVKGLLEARVTEPCLAMVVDPAAAQACAAAGTGATVTLKLGHQADPRWGSPIEVTGRVGRLSDGRFQYRGGVFGGTWASMGPCAVLEVGSIQVLIQTNSTYDWADEQYRTVGMRPETAKFVGAKNMMNFRNAYGAMMKGFFVLDLPGPTPPDMRSLPFTRAKRPWFPLDEAMENPELEITTSR
ncbi:MAG TPA: M81 family metallopeptidase [Candidatus Limnocylindrales bacterium]|nr:M81 family metallopeptidase [Candidatus Limnocylindrales bacterium]